MKSIVLKVLLLVCFVNLSKAQSIDNKSSKEFYFKSVLAEDINFNKGLSLQTEKSIINFKKPEWVSIRKDFNFDVSGIDFSPPKFMLEDRINFDNLDSFLFFCEPLENGLYQNFDSRNILIGSGLDYFVNEIIIKNVLNRKSFLRKD
ncbi:hypothetical protein ACPX19_09090 [Winogradskyella sp. HB-48]|uniref:hypothetical protein n=1 Tax=Winogradskyella sp. HB-48 TaxID=3416808 RepID=UPI003CECA5E8